MVAPLDTVTNPVLIVEVVSDSTAEYDRGEKFTLYQSIPTLREYLLVERKKVLIERFVKKTEEGVWAPQSHSDLTDAVPLDVVKTSLDLGRVYDRVFPR
jgi:Uma2 family endonuclease